MNEKKSKKQSKNTEKIAEISTLNAQIEELNNALLRERADAENVRRRAEDEKNKLGSFYKALVVKQLLPVVDNFERALRQAQADKQQTNEFTEGIQAIYKQFGDVLQKLDVERIKTVGEPFDPHTMEAVSAENSPDSEDDDQEIVSEELQSGYKLADELLRPAMVRIKN